MLNNFEILDSEQTSKGIPLPTPTDTQTNEASVEIDFNYRGMSSDERIRRAVHDMELIYASEEPPKMPQTIPRFVKAYLWNTPSLFQPGYSQAGFPAAATLMDDVFFRHPNNLSVQAKLNALIIGDSGVGKNGDQLISILDINKITAEDNVQ